jgi:ABC-type transport system involved in multi-copper enzyme maturation permease subunit
MTPLWLLSIGAALFLVGLAAVYGVLSLVRPSAALELVEGIKEGILLPILYLAVIMTVFVVIGFAKVPYEPLLTAVSRLHTVGAHEVEVTVPPGSHDFGWDLNFPTTEFQGFDAWSDQPVSLQTFITKGYVRHGAFKISEDEPASWRKITASHRPISKDITQWKFDNVTSSPAHVRLRVYTDIDFPEVRVIPRVVLSFTALFAVYFLLRWLAPKISAIALTTSKEVISQPLFYIALSLGAVALLAFIVIPYNTFGEDVKVLKNAGLTWIKVLAVLLAIWSASISIADEIEGRTALTLLSKPVKRRQFILGKFLGILEGPFLLFIILGVVFMATIAYKVVYDARETSAGEPNWQDCYQEVVSVVPSLVLVFLETVVLASISVAISTRLPMLPNLLLCGSIYVLGHLGPLLVQSTVGRFEIVRFIGRFLAMVLPVLDNFDTQSAISIGATLPIGYLGLALLYAALYSTIVMLLALMMFEDRDLA